MQERPNCICSHTYGQHAWGTGFCNTCECKKYREGLCPCGHAWETHKYNGESNTPTGRHVEFFNCTFCKAECKSWRSPEEKPEMNQPTPVDSVCTCDHYQISHIRANRSCGIAACICSSFTPKTPPLLACKHCIFQAIDNNTIKHSSACKLYGDATEVRTGERETRITWPDSVETTKYNGTARQWQKELEEEEKYKPFCVCGHGYESHYDSDDQLKLECAECFEPVGESSWETKCKDYKPQPKQGLLDYSDDPTVVNEAALKAIGNTGAMSPDEIQRKIDEWKLKNGTVPKQPVGYNYDASGKPFVSEYSGVWAKCWHKPTHVINGRTWGVWAGTKSDCMSTALDYDVLLNVSNGFNVVPQHDIPFKWARKYSETQTKEIMLDWPDQDAPIINPLFWKDLIKQLETNRQKMLIFCIGGHGRTGTAIACLLIAAFGWTAQQAKDWVWTNYCKEAIETLVQENYLNTVYAALYPPRKKRVKKMKG